MIQKALRAARLWYILASLAEAPARALSEAVLASALDELRLRPSSAEMRDDLLWLADRALLRIDPEDGFWIASLVARGADVAELRLTVDGITPPPPK